MITGKISGRKSQDFFGKYLRKQVIGNLAYPEMLFTKKTCLRQNIILCLVRCWDKGE